MKPWSGRRHAIWDSLGMSSVYLGGASEQVRGAEWSRVRGILGGSEASWEGLGDVLGVLKTSWEHFGIIFERISSILCNTQK